MVVWRLLFCQLLGFLVVFNIANYRILLTVHISVRINKCIANYKSWYGSCMYSSRANHGLNHILVRTLVPLVPKPRVRTRRLYEPLAWLRAKAAVVAKRMGVSYGICYGHC